MQQRNLHKQRDVLKTWWKEAKTIFLPPEKSWMTNSWYFFRLSLLPKGKQTFSLWLLLGFSFAQRAHMSGDIYWMLIETQWTVKDSSGVLSPAQVLFTSFDRDWTLVLKNFVHSECSVAENMSGWIYLKSLTEQKMSKPSTKRWDLVILCQIFQHSSSTEIPRGSVW